MGRVMREIETGGLYYTMTGETIVDPTRNLRNILRGKRCFVSNLVREGLMEC
jgi:hypothetical protein